MFMYFVSEKILQKLTPVFYSFCYTKYFFIHKDAVKSFKVKRTNNKSVSEDLHLANKHSRMVLHSQKSETRSIICIYTCALATKKICMIWNCPFTLVLKSRQTGKYKKIWH